MRITVFSVFLILMQIAFVLIYATTTVYAPEGTAQVAVAFPADISGGYSYFNDLHVLVFIGLGMMMSFVYRNSYTAAGMSLLLASFSVLWSILNYAFWQQAVLSLSNFSFLPIGQDTLAAADYAAAAVLVTFGVLMGRVSAAQAVVLAFFEVIVYNILVAIGAKIMVITDIGGSTHVFFFGSLFGLVASGVLAKLSNRVGELALSAPAHTSSTTAMVGTLFSWCFWPSFNSYTASNDVRESHAIVNTYIALCSSTIMAFAVSRLVGSGQDRARVAVLGTVAGGVAMGVGSVMLVRNFGALLIGAFAGASSVIAQQYLTPALNAVGVPDTVGAFSAFGIPGLIGTVVGMITSAAYVSSEYAPFGVLATALTWPELIVNNRGSGTQGAFQLAYLALALGFGLVFGAVGGFLMWLCPALETTYNDAEEWVLEGEVLEADVELQAR